MTADGEPGPSIAGAAGQITVDGLDFAYVEWGEPRGPLALCLHGFPDTAHTWRLLGPALAAAGHHVVAPFMRGYAPTAVPPDACYQTGRLALDAIALHGAFGGDERAVIVGHDWGATATYGAASHSPHLWRRVVGMAVPPGPAMGDALLGDLGQLKRSWYMFVFQHALADFLVAADDMAFLDMLWRDWSPGYDATDDLAHVRDSLRAPENLAAALGYYRAALGTTAANPALADVQGAVQADPPQPTLYLHGRDDGCVGTDVAQRAAADAPSHLTTEIIDGAGHFLHLERPDRVNERIVQFLQS